MPRIEWEDAYSVHVPVIDEQHRQWIDIINKLHDTLMQASDSATLLRVKREIMQQVKEYAIYHFACEEEYMEKIGFPGNQAHQAIHREFSMQIKKLSSDMQTGKIVLNTEIMNILMDWLISHILFEDKKLDPTVVSRDTSA